MKIPYENEKPAVCCTHIPKTEENTILCLREEPGGRENKHFCAGNVCGVQDVWVSPAFFRVSEINLVFPSSVFLFFFSPAEISVYSSTNEKGIDLPL